jgi:hypothetical protein
MPYREVSNIYRRLRLQCYEAEPQEKKYGPERRSLSALCGGKAAKGTMALSPVLAPQAPAVG